MARKIMWQEPELTTISSVEISRSTTKYGVYSVINTINATSDGLVKSSSNTWVTSYVDSSGTFDNWYKIRFYDSTTTLYSDYSDPISGGEEISLCSIEDVKNVIDTVGRFTDDEIFNAIKQEEEFIYIESGTPMAVAYSVVLDTPRGLPDTFYVGEENIHRVDRVFYGTATKFELYLDDSYKVNTRYGMVKLLPVASGGPTVVNGDEIEIRFVPKIYNRYATYLAAKNLIERVDFLAAGKPSKELEVVYKRLETIESLLREQIGVRLSSDYAKYDGAYGVNRYRVRQDQDRNRYIASTGWN